MLVEDFRQGLKKRFRQVRHPGRLFPEYPQQLNRPGVFNLLFWVVLVVSVLVRLYRGPDGGLVTFLLMVAALVVVWGALPWDRHVSARRKLLAPVFLAVLFLATSLSGADVLPTLYLAVFANGVFLFGFGGGLVYAAFVFLALSVNNLVILEVHGVESGILAPEIRGVERPGDQVIAWTAPFLPMAVFVIGLSASVVEAIRRREESQDLLAELEEAHSELQRYASSVRELAISEERTRVAREVHDTVGHYLTVVSLQLEAARKVMEKKPERSREEVEKAQEFASEALSEVRRSVRALKPLAVEERSGTGALAALVRSFEGAGPFVSFDIDGGERELPPEADLVLYRALQEGLTNAVRHSDARRVEVSLVYEETRVRLSVSDDGAGVPDGVLEEGFGLSALRERVELLEGALAVGNVPGGGFLLSVELPAGQP